MKSTVTLSLLLWGIIAFPQSEFTEKISNARNGHSQEEAFLPDYDINNTPIALWLLVSGDDYKGIIVTGHADSAVCEVASTEIANTLAKLPTTKESFFSFGICYDIRPAITDNDQQKKYNAALKDLHHKFLSMKKELPDRIVVNTIEYQTYCKKTDRVLSHIFDQAQKSTTYSNALEFDFTSTTDFPIIIPFFTFSGDTISFTLSRNKFNNSFKSIVYRSLTGEADRLIQAFRKIKYKNDSISDRLKITYKTYDFSMAATLDYIHYSYLQYTKEMAIPQPRHTSLAVILTPETIIGTLTTQDLGYSLRRRIYQNQTGTPVSYKEALTVDDPASKLYDLRYDTKAAVRATARTFTDTITKYHAKIKSIKQTIAASNHVMDTKILALQKFKKNIESRDIFDMTVDGFLRAWPFSTYTTQTDQELDTWYKTDRPELWRELLRQHPSAGVDQKIGGIFNADDVFFKVTRENNNVYRITPLKVIGNKFLVILDPQVSITQIITPFNLRK